MLKLLENFHILHFQKRIISAGTIHGNTPNYKELHRSCHQFGILFLFVGKAIISRAKGQLFSKCLLGVIVSTKKPTKFF